MGKAFGGKHKNKDKQIALAIVGQTVRVGKYQDC
jgi:hypothetical protein